MGDRFYAFIVRSAVLLQASILLIAIFVSRQYQRYLAAYKTHIRRVRNTLVSIRTYLCDYIGVKASPILILGAAPLFIPFDNYAVMFYLLGSGILITALWVFVDCRVRYKEVDVVFDVHDHVETLDRTTASEITEDLEGKYHRPPNGGVSATAERILLEFSFFQRSFYSYSPPHEAKIILFRCKPGVTLSKPSVAANRFNTLPTTFTFPSPPSPFG